MSVVKLIQRLTLFIKTEIAGLRNYHERVQNTEAKPVQFKL